MCHRCVRPSYSLALGAFLLSALISSGCGSSGAGTGDSEPSPSSSAGASPQATPATEPAPSPMPSAEDIAALTEVIGMAADQIQSACGATFDACGATPGCEEILTCAARNACSGADCYCLDADCSMDGPCRSVIESAPGARVPDASDPSLGPASDAARAVGGCLQGLGGGLPPSPSPAQPAAPADIDAGASESDAG